MKSHKIPRFLTKPWETNNQTFKVFSFKEKKIHEEDAKYFFAEDNRFTQEEEEFWNNNVETPLAGFLNTKSTTEKTKIIKVKNWKHIKAMHLLLPSIVERSWDNRPMKSFTFNKRDFEDSMWDWHKKHTLLILDLPLKEHRLLFPETGFFPLMFLTKENLPSAVQAIPILGNQLLISTPKQIDVNDIYKSARNGEYLINASISNLCDKIIVHPYMLTAQNEETLSKALYKMRQANSQHINNHINLPKC